MAVLHYIETRHNVCGIILLLNHKDVCAAQHACTHTLMYSYTFLPYTFLPCITPDTPWCVVRTASRPMSRTRKTKSCAGRFQQTASVWLARCAMSDSGRTAPTGRWQPPPACASIECWDGA